MLSSINKGGPCAHLPESPTLLGLLSHGLTGRLQFHFYSILFYSILFYSVRRVQAQVHFWSAAFRTALFAGRSPRKFHLCTVVRLIQVVTLCSSACVVARAAVAAAAAAACAGLV